MNTPPEPITAELIQQLRSTHALTWRELHVALGYKPDAGTLYKVIRCPDLYLTKNVCRRVRMFMQSHPTKEGQ